MKNKDLQLFANRPWEAIGEADAEYWLARKKRLGPAEGIRMADELRALVAAQRPDWPSAAERQADLEVHAHVSECLRRVPVPPAPFEQALDRSDLLQELERIAAEEPGNQS